MQRSVKIRRWLMGIGATLCLLVGLLLPASFVSAQNPVTVSVDAPATVAPGDYFNANINVSEIIGTSMHSVSLRVVFDGSVLEIEDIAPGADITNGLLQDKDVIDVFTTRQINVNTVIIELKAPTGRGAHGSGPLCQIRFHAIGAGGTSSDIDVERGTFQVIPGSLDASWIGTTVNISGTPPPETVTETPPPTTTPPPETVTETPSLGESEPFNYWPLVGGIIAVVVLVGLGIFFWMRRRAT